MMFLLRLIGGKALGWLAGAGALMAAVGVIFLRGVSAGRGKERAKQAKKDAAALEERHEMDREATEAERKAAGMTDEEARAEAMKWAKKH